MKKPLISGRRVYTLKGVGRQLLPDHLKRTKLLPIRCNQVELDALREASRKHGVPISEMVREGLKSYLQKLERKGESQKGGQP